MCKLSMLQSHGNIVDNFLENAEFIFTVNWYMIHFGDYRVTEWKQQRYAGCYGWFENFFALRVGNEHTCSQQPWFR